MATAEPAQPMRRQPDQDVPSPPGAIAVILHEIPQFLVQLVQRASTPRTGDQFPVRTKVVPPDRRHDRYEQAGVAMQALPKDAVDELIVAAALRRTIARLKRIHGNGRRSVAGRAVNRRA
jgi:hypothetical protein